MYVNEKIIARPPFTIRPTPAFSDMISISESFKRRKHASATVNNLTSTSFVLIQSKKCINEYIEPILNEKFANKNELWFPSDFMYFMAMNSIFSATFDYSV